MKKETKIQIKIDNWGQIELDYLVDLIKKLKTKGTWTFESWRPTPALIDKNGGTSRQFVGQHYDPKYIDLVQDGWTHDHCEICTKTISDNATEEDWVTSGYNSDNDWICEECFKLFMTSDDIEKELEKYERVEK